MDLEQLKQAGFSEDELRAMGDLPVLETPEKSPADEKKEPDKSLEPAGEKPPEKETAPKETELTEEKEPEEGKPVPYGRFLKVYTKTKQAERERNEFKEKHELLKTDPDAYYEKYPAEAPPPKEKEIQEEKSESVPERVATFRETLLWTINDPGQPAFHGKKIGDLMLMGPEGIAAAQDYYQQYRDSVVEKVQEKQNKERSTIEAIQKADEEFLDGLSRQMFNKGLKLLEPAETAKIQEIKGSILSWMKKTRKLAYSLEDAYFVMKKNDLLKEAMEKGAKGAIEQAKAGPKHSVSATGTDMKIDSGFGAYLSMTDNQLASAIDKMNDKQFENFLKNAPSELRKKFKNVPWT
jgi:hypothetical protein